MVAQFGTEVLSTPQTHGFDLLAWLLPLGGIALGAAAIAGGAWHWSRKLGGRDGSPAASTMAPDEERLVDDALAQFDD
jgi:cytochrome c-type biogenesis protein CcmH/NrfF